ncbi:MAG: Coenzyme F420 hydrogenase/dehydrogenase, beta subunit C-terminal domain [Clostridia bacterium]|nr:Coenzyme F420 hydrogenase/dehydrogenase, beta subunit C-terminal domain [Clostridia bacterium]
MYKDEALVCDQNMCTGCGLCINICPVNAISIEDLSYAQNAVIDSAKCIKCNRCHLNCPQKVPVNANKPIEWYQGWIDNSQDRKQSSSGGVAYAFAKGVIRRGGFVVSCLLRDGRFMFLATQDEEELKNFRGSKYVKSDPADVYKTVKSKLKDGNQVLFIGLPCQVAGIRRFIGEELDENLITVDLICHGTPSIRLLKQFLKQYDIDLEKVNMISFREKQSFSISTDINLIGPRQIYDRYTLAFLNELSYTDNCYSCNYACMERVSDITIGDSWGTDLATEERKGISLILCQSHKGISLLHDSDIITKPVDINNAVRKNNQLSRPSFPHKNRERFFKYLDEGKKFNRAVLLCLPKDCLRQGVKRTLLPIIHEK